MNNVRQTGSRLRSSVPTLAGAIVAAFGLAACGHRGEVMADGAAVNTPQAWAGRWPRRHCAHS